MAELYRAAEAELFELRQQAEQMHEQEIQLTMIVDRRIRLVHELPKSLRPIAERMRKTGAFP